MIQPAQRLRNINEYYFSRKLRELRQLQAQGREIINLGIGNPDLQPPVVALQTLAAIAADKHVHGYQPYKGVPSLRDAFARWYANYFGVKIDSQSQVLPLMGSKQGIFFITMAFVNPGETVLVPDPGYPAYRSVAQMLGAKVKTYDLAEVNGWLPDLASLEQQDLGNVKLMWVNYPHMPTGARANTAFFRRLIDFARRHQILVVNDNPYSFILNDSPLSLLSVQGSFDVALELNSLSKSHNMAGWRVGAVVGSKSYIDAIVSVVSNVESGMFRPVQEAAARALSVDDQWYRRLNKIYAMRRKIGMKILTTLGCFAAQSQAGMFLWARIPEGFTSSSHFSDYVLDKYDIFLAPGFIFGVNGDRYVRLSLAASTDNLIKALKRIVVNNKKAMVK